MEYKRVKDLKVGDKVWLYQTYMSYEKSGFKVLSIKKQKTLAIVTIKWDVFGKERELVCYGHVSGELLAFNGNGYNDWRHVPLVCDYRRIKEKTEYFEWHDKERNIGRAVLELKRELGL